MRERADARSNGGAPVSRTDAGRSGSSEGEGLDAHSEVVKVLEQTLNLKPSARAMTADTALLGAIPELDSMAVVSVITSLEERFGFAVADDEIDGSTFASVGSLVEFVERKLSG